jgi:nucleotide-binding universal stress UspA family protein
MYKKILAPLDGSQFSECSLDHVKTIARGCAVPEVVLLRVVEPILATDMATFAQTGIDIMPYMKEVESAAKSYIEKMAADLQKAGLQVAGIATVGRAADTILSYIDQNGVDLVVMSTHGRSGISRWFMGSVADKVVRNSKAPVLLISPPGSRVSPPS